MSLPAVDERRGPAGRTTGGVKRQVLTFVAGMPLPHVRCIAAGGFPPPDVSLYLDHSEITARFDVVQRSSLHGLDGLQVSPFDPTNTTATPTTASARSVLFYYAFLLLKMILPVYKNIFYIPFSRFVCISSAVVRSRTANYCTCKCSLSLVHLARNLLFVLLAH